MEWLDAMRGFTMILVVAYHVAQVSFGQDEKLSASLPFLVLFRMPLFFFVSGFLAYKANFVWTPAGFCSLAWKKVKIQVLPALIFLCVFLVFKSRHTFGEAFMTSMHSPTKGGYWFTWVLLQMFLFYYLLAYLQQALRLCSKGAEAAFWLLVWLLALGLYLSLYMPVTFGKWYNTDFMMYSSLYETLKFMHFFIAGNIVRRFWHRTQELMDSMWLFPCVVLTAVVCCADLFRWHVLQGELTNLPRTLAMYALMSIVVMTFRSLSDHLSVSTRVGSTLQYVGTRTLDVYLLHFIFLPRITIVGDWLNAHHPNFVIDIVAALLVAVPVLAFCLLTSRVLRVSPLLRQYLFGRSL